MFKQTITYKAKTANSNFGRGELTVSITSLKGPWGGFRYHHDRE